MDENEVKDGVGDVHGDEVREEWQEEPDEDVEIMEVSEDARESFFLLFTGNSALVTSGLWLLSESDDAFLFRDCSPTAKSS